MPRSWLLEYLEPWARLELPHKIAAKITNALYSTFANNNSRVLIAS